MDIDIQWCLDNLNKAYRIIYFNGSLSQFRDVLKEAQNRGLKTIKEIPESLIIEKTKS